MNLKVCRDQAQSCVHFKQLEKTRTRRVASQLQTNMRQPTERRRIKLCCHDIVPTALFVQ
jgi:hypothetical protein